MESLVVGADWMGIQLLLEDLIQSYTIVVQIGWHHLLMGDLGFAP